MITVAYKPSFIRQYQKLPVLLQDEVREKIALFLSDPHLASLRTHKLRGRLKGFSSFSVNYQFRIVFTFKGKNRAVLHAVGDHAVYG